MSKHPLEKPEQTQSHIKLSTLLSPQHLTPWLFVVTWSLVRLITSDTEYADLPPASSSVNPVLWELIWLCTVAGIVGLAQLLAWFAHHTVVRVIIALATYLTIPAAIVFLKTLLAPLPPGETYYNQFPESLILSLGVGIITILWASPLSTLRQLEWDLDAATQKLVALRASVLDVTLRAQRELAQKMDMVVAPEIEKVIAILSQAGFSSAKKSKLAAQIQTSVNDVLRPFSQRLINETSIASSEPLASPESARRRLKLSEPVVLRDTFLPLILSSIPAAWLAIAWWRDLDLSWPGSLSVLALSTALVILILATSAGAKALIPRTLRVHPLLALAVITPVNAAFCYLPLFILTQFPRGLWDYASWGFLSTFPAAGVTLAIVCPFVTIGGILMARDFDVIQRKKQVQTELARENAALATELWHLKRQTALMVHGPVQSALISTGLRFGAKPPSSKQATEMVGVLEKTLTHLRADSETESLLSFVASLEELWDGIATVKAHTQQAALDILETSPASLHACSEVIREGVNNAIFHGMATEIEVSVVMVNQTSVDIRVEDNGVGPSATKIWGMGSQLISTVSTGWNLRRLGKRTVLTANLFIPGPR